MSIKLTKSERTILTGLNTLDSKSASREVLRRWTKTTFRGIYLVAGRMVDKRLINQDATGTYHLTFKGRQALGLVE